MAETEMVERVADALQATGIHFHDREVWVRYARAAIEAMREPTSAMIENGATGTDSEGYGISDLDAEDVWHAMIDAALQGKG